MNWSKFRKLPTVKNTVYKSIGFVLFLFFLQKPVIPFPHFTDCPALQRQPLLTLSVVSFGLYFLPLNHMLHSLLGILSGLPTMKTV